MNAQKRATPTTRTTTLRLIHIARRITISRTISITTTRTTMARLTITLTLSQ